jgi:hypothetical protein
MNQRRKNTNSDLKLYLIMQQICLLFVVANISVTWRKNCGILAGQLGF